MDKPEELKPIRTHGFELVLVGVLAFATIIGITLAVYHLFILGRVRDSEEFHAASYFAANSQSLKEKLPATIEAIHFDDIEVNESEGFGVCEVFFDLDLKGGESRELLVGLVKIADFWIVYETAINPDASDETQVVSTYQKILTLLEKIDFDEFTEAEAILNMIRSEIRQPLLEEYLSAYLHVSNGNTTHAGQILRDLSKQAVYSKAAVMHLEATLKYALQDYPASIAAFLEIEKQYGDAEGEGEEGDESEEEEESIFANLPKDPFLALMDVKNVVASSRQMLALLYHDTKDYEKGLEWSGKAIKYAKKIDSTVIRSTAVFLKALNLYSLERYEKADKQFGNVIADLDNPNLSQKSWAYYFKADIAAREARHEDSLDYYEMAVALEPTNTLVRKGAIEYLVGRHYVGDWEIALGWALRGVDYGVEGDMFKGLASDLYRKLGMPDKTPQMQPASN